MISLAILYGGKSGEHDVSLRSAGSVYRHINRSKYNIVLIGVTIEGAWYLQKNAVYLNDGESLSIQNGEPVSIHPGKGLFSNRTNLSVDFVFPLLHGIFGEDGTLQGALETADLPYAGSGILGSAVGMDKCISKYLWQQRGLPIVPFLEINSLQDKNIERDAKVLGFPLFVKPARAGSSVGVRKVGQLSELIPLLKYALQFDTKALLEPAIEGREIECSVLGNSIPESFAPGEVVVSDGFYDYSNKYCNSGKAYLIVPADLSAGQKSKVQTLARKAFIAVGASGFARVDFFLEKHSGKILLNEINTLPGFTSISMFAKLCEEGGVPYSQVIDRVIMHGMEMYRKRKNLKRFPGPDSTSGSTQQSEKEIFSDL